MKPESKYIPFLLVLFGLSFTACGDEPLDTVDDFDVEKYMGKWYEIARLPNSFEKGLSCVTAEYALRDDGKIDVINSGVKENGKTSTSTAVAWAPDPDVMSRLKVRFVWPFAGDYYVMYVHFTYDYALVGSPSRKYLWVLGRGKSLDEEVMIDMKTMARNAGFDVSKLEMVDQTCDR